MTEEKLNDVIDLLDSFAMRTSMYVRDVNPAMVEAFLHGLDSACQILTGVAPSFGDRAAAAVQNGWDSMSGTGVFGYMKHIAMADDEMVQALIEVEKDAYRLAFARRRQA